MIDFLSDTVTRPTPQMRLAMAEAEVGDDVYSEDPTVHRLEALAAEMLGKQSACFVPSGTMANLISVMSHASRGTELLLGDETDMYNYEAGGVSICGGVVLHPLRTQQNGEISIEDLRAAIRDPMDEQCAPAGVITLENPHVRMGGLPLSIDYLNSVRAFSNDIGLPIHMDGARLFNASISLGVTADVIASQVDSVQFCLSKSLAAPVGSMVVGSADFIHRARRHRKMLGGGMRQAGVLAAAGIISLTKMVDRLIEDHERAQRMHFMLGNIDEVELLSSNVPTNMFFFRLRSKTHLHNEFLRDWKSDGIRAAELGVGQIRIVTHYHHSDADILTAVDSLKRILMKQPYAKSGVSNYV